MHQVVRRALLLVALFAVGVLALLALPAQAAPPPAPEPPSLFLDAGAASAASAPGAGVLRQRLVRVDFAALDRAADAATRGRGRAGSRGRAPSRLRLELFPDTVTVTELREIRSETPTTLAWLGGVAGARGEVTLVWGNGVLTGHLWLDDTAYRVRSSGGGLHRIEELDPAAFPPEAEPLSAPSTGSSGAPGSAFEVSDLPDSGEIIDVLVVYTGAARAAAGSGAAIESEIAGAIADANAAFANSALVQRIRLVHTAEVDYIESGNPSTELTRLRGTSDGYLDGVHALRNHYRADLVAMVVSNMSGACGIGYVMTTNSTSFAPNAFSVTDRDCFFQYTLAHEMGHNMGCQHDPPNAGTNPVFPYSYGYTDAGHGFRTVMAYPCPGVSCPRIRHWSDDTITYQGAATGNSGQDNSRSLDNVRVTVANFRSSGGAVD